MGFGGGCDVGKKHRESLCIVVVVMGRIFFYRLELHAGFCLYCSLAHGMQKSRIILYRSCDGGCGIRYTREAEISCIAIFVLADV